MAILAEVLLLYFAVGAILFAHPAGCAIPDDFHWRRQIAVFRATFFEVLCWPRGLWRFWRAIG